MSDTGVMTDKSSSMWSSLCILDALSGNIEISAHSIFCVYVLVLPALPYIGESASQLMFKAHINYYPLLSPLQSQKYNFPPWYFTVFTCIRLAFFRLTHAQIFFYFLSLPKLLLFIIFYSPFPRREVFNFANGNFI